jgi:DNA-binding transcriptional regulator YiaG
MLGLSQFAFGRKIRVIAEKVREWEHGASEPPPHVLAKVQQLVADTAVVATTAV